MNLTFPLAKLGIIFKKNKKKDSFFVIYRIFSVFLFLEHGHKSCMDVDEQRPYDDNTLNKQLKQ